MSEAMKSISDAEFNAEVLESAIPVFVDFWAPWCSPCIAVGPMVEELASEYDGKVAIVKMNVDENPVTSQTFGVSSIPTFLLFKGGQLADRTRGLMPKSELKRFLDRNLASDVTVEAASDGGAETF